jgi:hypothetical protein
MMLAHVRVGPLEFTSFLRLGTHRVDGWRCRQDRYAVTRRVTEAGVRAEICPSQPGPSTDPVANRSDPSTTAST